MGVENRCVQMTPKDVCSVEGCCKIADRRGWCTAHYMRWVRNGDPQGGRFYDKTPPPVVDSSGYMAYKGGPLRGKREHVVIAELALGKSLPKGAIVHHVDTIRANNTPTNLVVCQDQAYHSLLHMRAKAIAAGCPAVWVRCRFCGRFADKSQMQCYQYGNVFISQHQECSVKDLRERRRAGKR